MFKNILSTFFSRFITSVVSFAIIILISREFESEGRGISAIFISLIAFVVIINNIVGGPTLVYLVPRYKLKSLLVPSYLWSVISAIGFYFFLKNTTIVSAEFHLPLSLAAFFQCLSTTNLTILIGKEKIAYNNFLTLFQVAVLVAFLTIAFYMLDWKSLSTYVNGLIISFGASALISSILVLRQKQNDIQAQPGVVKEMVRLGLINQIAAGAQFLNYRLSFFILEKYYSESEVGIYGNGAAISEAVWLIGNSIALVQYSKIANSSEREYNTEITSLLSRMNFILTVLGTFIICLLPEEFYTFIFGEDFKGIKQILLLLAPGIIIFSYNLTLSHYFSGIGKYSVNTKASLLGLAVVLFPGIWLIKSYGMQGAAVTAVVSYFISTTFLVINYLSEPGTSWKTMLPGPSDISLGISIFRRKS